MNIDQPDENPLLYAAMGAIAVLCLIGGITIGWMIWGRPAPSVEGPQPEQRQPGGALELERRPQLELDTRLANPPHGIPKGSTEERRVSVTVQPYEADCPPVHVVLSVVRDADGGARVVASSPDGRVTGGVDVPMPVPLAMAAAVRRPWAAGVSYAGQQAYGVFVHRDIWRLRAGLEVNAVHAGGAEARALIGWTW